jgi:hypothetical protein
MRLMSSISIHMFMATQDSSWWLHVVSVNEEHRLIVLPRTSVIQGIPRNRDGLLLPLPMKLTSKLEKAWGWRGLLGDGVLEPATTLEQSGRMLRKAVDTFAWRFLKRPNIIQKGKKESLRRRQDTQLKMSALPLGLCYEIKKVPNSVLFPLMTIHSALLGLFSIPKPEACQFGV